MILSTLFTCRFLVSAGFAPPKPYLTTVFSHESRGDSHPKTLILPPPLLNLKDDTANIVTNFAGLILIYSSCLFVGENF